MNSKSRASMEGDCITWRCCTTNALHREGAPAIEWHNGNKMWYLHDALHRKDGPAIIYTKDNALCEMWYQHGALHREDGKALIYADGGVYYCTGTSYGNDAEAWAKAVLQLRLEKAASLAPVTPCMVQEFLKLILTKQVNNCL